MRKIYFLLFLAGTGLPLLAETTPAYPLRQDATAINISGQPEPVRVPSQSEDKSLKGEQKMNNGEKSYTKPSQAELKKKLTDLQYHVTQENGTEPPFKNAYWDHHEQGIYVDIVSGEPLFGSQDKFDSGTGWPSFTAPLVPENVITEPDFSYGMLRTEVRSRYGDSHLGHLFKDGPRPAGLRYCINSAALHFIPAGELAKEGYEEFLYYFE